MNIEKGSMIQVAIDALKEKGSEMSFPELWAVVKETLEITPEEEMNRIGHFYADLSLSGAVIVLADNYWDLADRHDLQAKVEQYVLQLWVVARVVIVCEIECFFHAR